MVQKLNSCIRGDTKMTRSRHAIVHRSKFVSSINANDFSSA